MHGWFLQFSSCVFFFKHAWYGLVLERQIASFCDLRLLPHDWKCCSYIICMYDGDEEETYQSSELPSFSASSAEKIPSLPFSYFACIISSYYFAIGKRMKIVQSLFMEKRQVTSRSHHCSTTLQSSVSRHAMSMPMWCGQWWWRWKRTRCWCWSCRCYKRTYYITFDNSLPPLLSACLVIEWRIFSPCLIATLVHLYIRCRCKCHINVQYNHDSILDATWIHNDWAHGLISKILSGSIFFIALARYVIWFLYLYAYAQISKYLYPSSISLHSFTRWTFTSTTKKKQKICIRRHEKLGMHGTPCRKFSRVKDGLHSSNYQTFRFLPTN